MIIADVCSITRPKNVSEPAFLEAFEHLWTTTEWKFSVTLYCYRDKGEYFICISDGMADVEEIKGYVKEYMKDAF